MEEIVLIKTNKEKNISVSKDNLSTNLCKQTKLFWHILKWLTFVTNDLVYWPTQYTDKQIQHWINEKKWINKD